MAASSWARDADRPPWASPRKPVLVPLLGVFVLTSILALGPLSEIWRRARALPACWTSMPPGCAPKPSMTGPIVALVVIGILGLVAAIAVVAIRLRDDAERRDLEDDPPGNDAVPYAP